MAKLKKQLRLLDVYVISIGAMFSSGFFLLPGLATGTTGPSVVLAFAIAGLLMVPAMVSQAELSTAMPKAGGAYYVLDRTLGPLVGICAGLGTWLTLMLKSAFALVGMGAYLGVVFDLPIVPVALACTAIFAVLNLVGARQASGVVRVLVFGLFIILGLYLIHGGAAVWSAGVSSVHAERFEPFFTGGVDGLLATVGLVFISFVGLTKVSSLAEEVTDPERNIPLGMALSLGTVTAIYAGGVYVMVATLGAEELSASLTPVADSAAAFVTWVPREWGVGLIVVAAVAAFVSTANTGILAASRFPLAMARDRSLPDQLARVSARGTPVLAILLSASVIAVFILTLDVVAVAKIASALQLVLFSMLNLAVVVMRESQIESYDPGYRSPLYPWMQVVGIVVPFFLVAEMGWLPALFVVGVFAASFVWYVHYARARIAREGAIFHVFARLGRRRFAGLDRELRDIMKEKGVRAEDPFDEVVARAAVLDVEEASTLTGLIDQGAQLLSQLLPASGDEMQAGLLRDIELGAMPTVGGVALVHTRLPDVDACEMVLVRTARPVEFDCDNDRLRRKAQEFPVRAMFILVSGDREPGRHLRILAQLAGRMDDDGFIEEWLAADGELGLKEILLRDDRYLAISVAADTPAEGLIGKSLRDLRLPEGCLVALVRRYGVTMVPRGRTELRAGDRLTIIGDPMGLKEIQEQFGPGRN